MNQLGCMNVVRRWRGEGRLSNIIRENSGSGHVARGEAGARVVHGWHCMSMTYRCK